MPGEEFVLDQRIVEPCACQVIDDSGEIGNGMNQFGWDNHRSCSVRPFGLRTGVDDRADDFAESQSDQPLGFLDIFEMQPQPLQPVLQFPVVGNAMAFRPVEFRQLKQVFILEHRFGKPMHRLQIGARQICADDPQGFIGQSPRFVREALGMALIACLAYVLSGRVGGITAANIPAYRAAGASAFGIGSTLYSPGRPAAEVARIARELVAVAAS